MTRKLTSKQEAFRIAYLENGGNARQAYRLAYDCEGMADQTVDKEAAKLLKHEKIRPLLDRGLERIQIQADAKGLLSLEEHMERLDKLGKAAEADGKYAAAITAEVKRGELRRFYVKQVETGEVGAFSQMTDEELKQYIEQESEALGVGGNSRVN